LFTDELAKIPSLEENHHRAMITTLTFKISSVVILFLEATELSLENRHIELSMQYAANLKAYP
jgi:hypothetical protein